MGTARPIFFCRAVARIRGRHIELLPGVPEKQNLLIYERIERYSLDLTDYHLCSIVDHSFMHLHFVLRQIHSTFQNGFSTQRDVVFSLAYFQCRIVFLRSSSSWLRLLRRLLVTFIIPFIFPSIKCSRRQFVRKLWPIQLAFLHFTLCMILLSSLTPCNASSFLTRSVQLIFSIFL